MQSQYENIGILKVKEQLYNNDQSFNILLDVRTKEECIKYGVPDYQNLIHIPIDIEKPLLKSEQLNFFIELDKQKISLNTNIFVICKAGIRSNFVCKTLAKRGYQCYNIVDGFYNSNKSCWKNNLPVKNIN